jgi:hypothetical protein
MLFVNLAGANELHTTLLEEQGIYIQAEGTDTQSLRRNTNLYLQPPFFYIFLFLSAFISACSSMERAEVQSSYFREIK